MSFFSRSMWVAVPSIQGSTRHNSSHSHYGGPFGDESSQTSMPSCTSRMHGNYSWDSKVVGGSEVCDRASACSVLHRPSSNVAKVSSGVCV
jgi:hypothetical protein